MPRRSIPSSARLLVAEAVLDEVLERGLQSVTLSRIAGRTGLAVGSIRHFFADFDEVLAFTSAVPVARMRERTPDPVPGSAAPPLDPADVRGIVTRTPGRLRRAYPTTMGLTRADTPTGVAGHGQRRA